MKSAADLIVENEFEDVVIFHNPSYDSALIGVDTNNRAVYDYEEMLRYLCETDGMTYEEAADFVSYNTIRSLDYQENAPIIVYRFYEEADYDFEAHVPASAG